MISFDTTQYGVVYQVISGPNNWLISLTYGKYYICIFGIDEQRLIKAFSFEWSSYRLLYYERLLFLYNTKDLIISLNYDYYYNLDKLDLGIKKYTSYIYDVSGEKMYFYKFIEESNEEYIMIFHSTDMETINDNPYKFKYPIHIKPGFFYLLDLQNLLLISSSQTLYVFDKINNTLLHTKDKIGVNGIKEEDPCDGSIDYFNPSYGFYGLLKISEELVLVREREFKLKIYGHVYI